MNVSRTKKQHVVPRFYLNKFADDNGNVWTYSGDSAPRPDKPEATAVESNIYTPADADGERFDDAEKILGLLESNAAPLWDDLCEGRVFGGGKRDHIALFMAAQYLRSPSVIRAGAEMAGSMIHHTQKFMASDKDAHERSMKKYEAETGISYSPEEREKIREFILEPKRYSIDVLRSAGLGMLGSTAELAELFINMNWVVAHSEDQHLITSDSPVTRRSDPATHHPAYGDGAFMNKTVRVQFPLSPRRIIEMSWSGQERERVVELPKKLAKVANGVRAASAERFVYGSKRDQGIEKLSKKWLSKPKTPKIWTSDGMPEINVKRKLYSR